MKPIKVAFIVSALANRGVISYVKDLSEELTKKNCDCSVYYFDEKVDLRFNCHSERISIFHKIDFNSFDIIHSHSLRPNLYIFLHRKKSDKARFITTLHNYVKQDLAYTYNRFVSFVFSRIWNVLLIRQDLLVCLTKDAEEYYRSFSLNKNITYVHSGRNSLSHDEDINSEDKELIALLKSRYRIVGANAVITHIKGLELIVQFLVKNAKYAFIIAGDGKDRAFLESHAEKLGVSNRCFFLGYRDRAARYLKAYDIYAMPSRSEGFPLGLLEAVSNRIPAVVSDLKSFKEIFGANEVTMFELDNSSSLQDAFDKLEDPKYRDSVVENAFAKFSSAYTASAMADRYLSLYQNLIKK
jgi:glycosyltransferase involved in cell wall biosynthesis